MKKHPPSKTSLNPLHPPDQQISWKIRRVVGFVHQNYYRPLSIPEMGVQFGYHPDYLSRKFKREIGIPFQEYIFRLRVQKAESLLENPQKSIKEICYDLGFSRPEFFSRTFKRINGWSPSQFRSLNPRIRPVSSKRWSPPSLNSKTDQNMKNIPKTFQRAKLHRNAR